MPRLKKSAIPVKTSSWRGFRNSSFFVVGLILLIFFGISFIREAVRSYEIQKEVSSLESEIQLLEERNAELASIVQYLNTDVYREKEARLRLNMQASGEQVVVVPDEYLDNEYTTAGAETAIKNSTYRTNPQKWWDYFFGQTSQYTL